MAYETFLELLVQKLQSALGDDFQFILRPLPRNNGVTLDGLTLQGPGIQLAPTIYLNPYYQRFLKGTSINSIISEILQLYHSTPSPFPSNSESLADFELLKSKIMFRMIHRASNQVLLSDVPHIPYMDLAIIFFLALEKTNSGQITALIHNNHARMWNVSTKDLWKMAQENTPREYPAEIKSMTEILKEISLENPDHICSNIFSDIEEQDSLEIVPLYILSNQSGLYGASCMIYQDILKDFANQLEKDLIILPSSVHEVLLTPDTVNFSYDDLSTMVQTINTQDVSLEDRLSNQVYLYTRKDNQINIASRKYPDPGLS